MLSGNSKNRNHNGLAIVLPAYKRLFFKETLESICNQTCKDFTLYIGDDSSLEDLYDVVKDYEHRINIVYHRFQSNLGSSDLVAHWERCIDLTQGEEWLWLFSDDDLMEPDNVTLFYEYAAANPDSELLHFNTKIINENNTQLLPVRPFPSKLDTSTFFAQRLRSKIHSSVVEYVFTKNLYLKNNKFEHFDLGWYADDATWIKFSRETGIRTIEGTFVRWRYSGSNISSRVNDETIIKRKLKSSIEYLRWTDKFFALNNLVDGSSRFYKLKLILLQIGTSSITLHKQCLLAISVIKELRYYTTAPFGLAYLLYINFKKTYTRAIEQ